MIRNFRKNHDNLEKRAKTRTGWLTKWNTSEKHPQTGRPYKKNKTALKNKNEVKDPNSENSMEKLVQNRIACDERTAWKKLAESGTASKIWKILQNCRKRKRYLQKVEKTQKVENHVKTRKTPKI